MSSTLLIQCHVLICYYQFLTYTLTAHGTKEHTLLRACENPT